MNEVEQLERVLGREQFADWLAEQEPEAVVGRAMRCAACPIANFLRGHGLRDATVLPDRVGWLDAKGRVRVVYVGESAELAWVRDFVAEVDYAAGKADAPINVALAQRVLARCQQPVSCLVEVR